MSTERISEYLAHFAQTRSLMVEQLRRVIVGQSEVIEQILAAIFTRGHCLLVGVPGLAKTLLVSSISQILDVSFKRIQFTPDLMPSDITGTTVLDEQDTGRRDFRFVRGPIFANIILADEINRTPPKTQAALLQSMQERQVSVGQETYNLPEPFFVIATQNPIEQEGTYPLPEAQLDRFMFNIRVDYPSFEEEKRILATTTRGEAAELTTVLNAKAIVNLQKMVHAVPAGEFVIDYVARLVRATRPKDPTSPEYVKKMVDWGAGPRAGQFLILGGKAMAAMDGRFSVAIDDIKKVAIPVLRHRVSTNFQAQAEGKTSEDIIEQLLTIVGEPEIAKYERAPGTEGVMSQWLRVFSTIPQAPEPAALVDQMRQLAGEARGDFQGDEQGWFRATFDLGPHWPPLGIDRYLSTEEGIRHDLNAWEAWLETLGDSPAAEQLMHHLTATVQVFTLERPQVQTAGEAFATLMLNVARYLCAETAGVFHVDGEGFYRPNGELLLSVD